MSPSLQRREHAGQEVDFGGRPARSGWSPEPEKGAAASAVWRDTQPAARAAGAQAPSGERSQAGAGWPAADRADLAGLSEGSGRRQRPPHACGRTPMVEQERRRFSGTPNDQSYQALTRPAPAMFSGLRTQCMALYRAELLKMSRAQRSPQTPNAALTLEGIPG